MNIAFIGQKGIPAHSGGVERHVEELAGRLARKGHHITVYARKNYTKRRAHSYKGVRIIYLPSIATKNLNAITHTFLATIHALFSRFDVVHYHSIGPSSLAWIIRLFRPDILVVSTFHCKDYEHKKWGLFARWYLRFGEFITCLVPHALIVVSQELKEYVHKRYKREAFLIPNGSNAHYTASQKAPRKWGLKQKQYILSVSRLVRHKQIHQLLEAFIALKQTKAIPYNIKLAIVGSGAYTDTYVKELKERAYGRGDIIFTGEQHGKALCQLFSHGAVFVQPSVSEGLSLALLEAMGHGLIPVVSDIPANREAVGECGLIFKAGNVVSLQHVMGKALSHSNQFSFLGKAAKKRARTYFHWNTIVGRTLALYYNNKHIPTLSLRLRKFLPA